MAEPSSRRQVAEQVATEIKAEFDERVHEVRLYGSVATGTGDETSDIDLLLVVDHKEGLDGLSRILGERMARSGQIIHLVTVTPDELEDLESRDTPFSKAIRREGEALA